MSATVLERHETKERDNSLFPSARIPELDGLRGFAILLVIIGHYVAAEHAPYLIHLAFGHLAHPLLLHATPQIYNARGVSVFLLALVLTLGVAAFSWRYSERPLIRRGHTFGYAEAAAAGRSQAL